MQAGKQIPLPVSPRLDVWHHSSCRREPSLFFDRQNSLSMLSSSRSLLSAFIRGLTKNCANMSRAYERGVVVAPDRGGGEEVGEHVGFAAIKSFDCNLM